MKYIVIGRETLRCEIEVEASSRKEALQKAEERLAEGLDGWDSIGRTLTCRGRKEGDAE